MRYAWLSLILLVSAAAGTVPPAAAPPLPTTLDLDAVRGVVVQYDGRYQPLDTLARDVVGKISGRRHYRNADPVALLLAWTCAAEAWQTAPLIPIRNAALRKELQLPAAQEVYSFQALVQHEPLRQLADAGEHRAGGGQPDALQKKVGEIGDQLVLLQQVFRGDLIRLVPVPAASAPWGSTTELVRDAPPALQPARQAWLALAQAFLADEPQAWTAAAASLRRELAALPAAERPAPTRIATELRYHRLRPFRLAWLGMGLGALLAAGSLGVRRRWLAGVAAGVFLAGWAVLTYGICLRGLLAGHLPAANMFESLLFLSWGAGAVAVPALLSRCHRSVPLTAAAIGALSLLLADCLPLDAFIRPAPPVLRDTIWMSIHVPVIMIAYAVLAIAVAIAHVQIVVLAAAPRRQAFIQTVDALLYGYLGAGALLLFAGIATGSLWAASSWGRYWGWDPKEVWSLVALLGYLCILHVRRREERLPRWAMVCGAALGLGVLLAIARGLAPGSAREVFILLAMAAAAVVFLCGRGEFATAAQSILAFWLIIMTYVGVNYVLGTGLHSYGFGVGAVGRRLLEVGLADLALLGLCAALWWWRRPGTAGLPSRPHEV